MQKTSYQINFDQKQNLYKKWIPVQVKRPKRKLLDTFSTK